MTHRTNKKNCLVEELTAVQKRVLRNSQRAHLAKATALKVADAPKAQIDEEVYQARSIGLRLDGWCGVVPR